MKITKKHLTKLIKEELEKSIEEAEVVQEIYWPFIGGKADPDTVWKADDHLKRSHGNLNKYKSAMEDSDIARAEDFMSRMEKVLKSISKRHSKEEFEHFEKVWRRRQKDVEEILDAGSKAWNKQKGAKAAEKRKWAEEARVSTARRLKRKREDMYAKSRAAMEDEEEYERGGSDDYHLVNPGFAGTGNMGYGESLDRKKISKSKLAQIIKEELENLLK